MNQTETKISIVLKIHKSDKIELKQSKKKREGAKVY